jgi:hypothetical protein
MSNYYSNSADYHDAVDAFEARMRSEEADREESKRKQSKPVSCACFEYIGDNPECPIHGADNDDSTAYDKERAELYTIGMGA